MYVLSFIFFFSSRRRHTSSYGDWSSDVCSSDLVGVDVPAAARELDPAALGETEVAALADDFAAQLVGVDPHGIVGLVADVQLRLGGRLDVVPMPPFHSRSTGASRIARINSLGVS